MGEEMAKVEIPLTFGTVLIGLGLISIIVSIIALLGDAPAVGSAMGGAELFTLITRYLISWFFLFFGAILIVMGIRRIKPVDTES